MLIEKQLDLLRQHLGEPVNPDDARFQPPELLASLIEGREWFAENSMSFQVQDEQETNPGNVKTAFYNVKNDLIKITALTWDGRPLTPVEPRDWRDRIGIDDTITGIPYVYKYRLRRLQLFFVPDSAKTLSLEGYAYPIELAGITGEDTDFTNPQARGAIWRAAWTLKDDDERDSKMEQGHAERIAKEFHDQYKPKGPRFVRSETVANPLLGFLRNNS